MTGGGLATKAAGLLDLKIGSEPGSFTGLGSVFDNVDSDGDVIAPGAFKASLEAHAAAGTWPALLWQHNTSLPVGEWESIQETARGLEVAGQLWVNSEPADGLAHRAWRYLKARGRRGLSIGFRIKRQRSDRTRGVRIIEAVELVEISIVTEPANPAARVDTVKEMKFLDAQRAAARLAAARGAVALELQTVELKIRNVTALIRMYR
jgi:HK97 family phage prohead protease